MRVEKEKDVKKYLKSLDAPTRDKINKAIDGLAEWQGDIKKVEGAKNAYRLKIDHYRVGFTLDREIDLVTAEFVGPRGDFYKHFLRR